MTGALLSILVAVSGAGQTGASAPTPPALQATVNGIASRLEGRSGRAVLPPRVRVATAAERRRVLAASWAEGFPWTADEASGEILRRLGLFESAAALDEAVARVAPAEPGPVATLDGAAILVSEELARGTLVADEMLEAVGVSSMELRLLAEVARSAARRRLARDGLAPEARLVRWSLSEAYARLCVTDRLLRAGGVPSEDAGSALVAVDPPEARAPADPGAVGALPPAAFLPLRDGPDEAFRLLAQRLLAAGWDGVEAVLDRPPPTAALLDPDRAGTDPPAAPLPPSGTGAGPARETTLGPFLVHALLGECAGAGVAREILPALTADRASLETGGARALRWGLVFEDQPAAGAFAAAWRACLPARHPGAVEAEEPGAWSWPGGRGSLRRSGSKVLVEEWAEGDGSAPADGP